ncbi:hypothetical protein Ait01nite_026860 [Actinoplanes italicus]|uniref:Uncharacterized protein n=1 Tax=Actinoplanes italicus TaxID=113567 RepID=A0A2T0KEY1_9ACTN|nr:hypothetical protein [Actinoplanes italicus]PRX21942.1 hypothetical protein CLV67_105119 [Actinoplanes italicus]GIE29641.1 hypothetical protein Ait01nite_026860 [Actinoplanes italicus]
MIDKLARLALSAGLLGCAVFSGATSVQAAPGPIYGATPGNWYWAKTGQGAVAIRWKDSGYNVVQVRYQRRVNFPGTILLTYFDGNGRRFDAPQRVQVQPGNSHTYEWFDDDSQCVTGRITISGFTNTPTICR